MFPLLMIFKQTWMIYFARGLVPRRVAHVFRSNICILYVQRLVCEHLLNVNPIHLSWWPPSHKIQDCASEPLSLEIYAKTHFSTQLGAEFALLLASSADVSMRHENERNFPSGISRLFNNETLLFLSFSAQIEGFYYVRSASAHAGTVPLFVTMPMPMCQLPHPQQSTVSNCSQAAWTRVAFSHSLNFNFIIVPNRGEFPAFCTTLATPRYGRTGCPRKRDFMLLLLKFHPD